MKFQLKIDCDNEAFRGDYQGEVARILHETAERIGCGAFDARVRDTNGNTVGWFTFAEALPRDWKD